MRKSTLEALNSVLGGGEPLRENPLRALATSCATVLAFVSSSGSTKLKNCGSSLDSYSAKHCSVISASELSFNTY